MKEKVIVLVVFVFSIMITGCISQKKNKKISYQTKYKFSDELSEIIELDAQTGAFFLSTIGLYKESLEIWDKAIGKESFPQFFSKDSLKQVLTPVDAVDFIVARSRLTDYIILNEAHHRPDHRVFAKKLLKGLFDNGYRNLAIETLSTDETYRDTLLNARKYPLITSGSYSREPQFGDFIREALEMGFYIFPYDDQDKFDQEREIAQAQNIINNQKEGKTFVYGGFQHALEGGHIYWGKAMAENLKQISGEDPLTIDQVLFSERSKKEYNHSLYNMFNYSKSSVLIDKEEKSYIIEESGGYYDIAVFHPKTQYINDRPHWVFDGDKIPVKIELKDIKMSAPLQILAFKENEDHTVSVPVDMLEVEGKNKAIYLSLKKGNYTILIVDKNKEGYKFLKTVE